MLFSHSDIQKIVELVWDGDNYNSLEEAWLNEGPWCITELLKERYKIFLKFGEVFVYEEDGDILGFVEILPTKTYNKTVYLEYIEVKKSERRKRIGRKLIEFVSEHYKKKGYERMIVVPEEDVVGFYEKIGFKKWKEFVCYKVDAGKSREIDITLRLGKIRKEDILGREIITSVNLLSEHVLIFQEEKLGFYKDSKDIFGYLNGKPFMIRIFKGNVNIFIWDRDILKKILVFTKKIAKEGNINLTVWKNLGLELENIEKLDELFYMEKILVE